jgi:hypothetical protein
MNLPDIGLRPLDHRISLQRWRHWVYSKNKNRLHAAIMANLLAVFMGLRSDCPAKGFHPAELQGYDDPGHARAAAITAYIFFSMSHYANRTSLW